jgi:hypothetical protein
LGGAGGLQLTISGLVAVVDSVGSCRWGVAELIDEAVFESVVVGGARIGVEQVWEGALFDLATHYERPVTAYARGMCSGRAVVRLRACR